MMPPVFRVAADSPAVLALLGENPTRLYPFGEARQNEPLPYAVWQLVSGFPENYLAARPDIDSFITQIDVYGRTAEAAREVAEALRDAFEPHAHVVSWRGESRDSETRNYRYSFDVEWFTPR